ncbi:glycosyltransferase family 10 [Aestuariivita sp.]|jgi:hypothetical protein|uniref:glycosyltransferase family 10 domain-containing protein n=1 Tax=Aestuariivita sp. TaxID=1872407 RepID=UPI00216F8BA0|nr:glycosyltransferase family 10 [Aestuariivita sp.]MCE8007743.1 hypothetical protein [Aestuariivita sp.]
MTQPAIAVLPYGLSLGRAARELPLDRLNWPFGRPDRLSGGSLGDLGPDDHLIVYPKTKLHVLPSFGTRARISLVMGEPSVIHAKHITLLRLTHRRFFRVLSFNEDLLAAIPNGLFFPYGTTWVPEWRGLDRTKHRHMSLIASAKRDTEGHRLRHAMVSRVQQAGLDVDVMGRGYTPFDAKSEGLAPYRFSVVIENVRERNYFSEKLIDAVLCDTVPIYWGCPNIDAFAQTDGMVLCRSEDELWQAIRSATAEEYARRLPSLKAAQPSLAAFCDLEHRAAAAIRDAL